MKRITEMIYGVFILGVVAFMVTAWNIAPHAERLGAASAVLGVGCILALIILGAIF